MKPPARSPEFFGGSARGIQPDVSDSEDITLPFQQIESKAGRLDTLFNNEGVGGNCSALEETDERWNRMMNTSSQAASMAIMNHLAYSCLKAAPNSPTKGMALESAQLGITVNRVPPTHLMSPETRPHL